MRYTDVATISISDGGDSGAPLESSLKSIYWGPVSTTADHSYTIGFVATSTSISFRYFDDYYRDNLSLTHPLQVQIYLALPTSPGNLSAVSDRPNKQINLAWQNIATDATNILVQRSLDGGAFQQIATLPATATAYSDGSAVFNHQYTYRLQSVNAFGQSGYSNIASAVLINLAPRIATLGPQVVSLGEEFKLSVDATDPEDGKAGLTYALLNASAGAAIDANGQIHGWFGEYLDEMRVWTVKVTDNDGLSSTELISILVAPTLDSIPHATTPASAVPLTPTTLTLSVIASANGNSGGISYLWETISHPGQVGLPTFSVNDGSDASQTVAALHGAGTYVFRVIMSNDTNYPGHADVSVTVDQSLGSVVVTPLLAVANPGSTQTFTAQALDQFGLPMATQPTFAWSISGGTAGGTINPSTGVYTRPSSVTGTPSDIINATATVNGVTKTGIASVTVPAVAAAAPTIATAPTATPVNQTQIRLTVLGGNPGGVESDLIYVWSATNLPTGAAAPSFSANGTNSAKTVIVTCDSAYPLNYTFSVTIQNRQGMTVSQSVTIADNQTFTKVVITPQQSSIGVNRQVSYTAQAQDQYSRAMASQPSFSWSVTDTSNTVLHTGNGASFAYTPAVSGAQQVTATATVGSIQLTVQAGLTVISLGPSIRQIVSIAGNDDGSPQTIGSDMPVTIISYNPDGTSAPWALWLIPTGGGGDGTGGGPVLLASGTQSVGQPGNPQQVATVGPSVDGNGTYTLVLNSSTIDPTASIVDSKSIQINNSNLTALVNNPTWITLSWRNLGSNTQYLIFRGLTPNFQPSFDNEVGEQTITAFEDDGLAGATTYTYIILAVTGDGPVMSVGNISVTTSTTGGPVPSVPLSNLQAIGVNDLEVLITWDAPTQLPVGYEIQESADGVHGWSYVAEVNRSTATSCLVRGCGVNGSGFMQEGATYYFRVGQILTYLSGASAWSAAVPAMVKIPDPLINSGKDMIVICGGRNGNMNSMLQGIHIRNDNSGLPLEGGSGLAKLWVDLIDEGFNAFLVPDPEDGGSFSSTGEPGVDYIFPADETHLKSTLNNDGSGRIYDEIQYEFSKGIYNLGLIGYSHGAGMTENISNKLWTDSQTPSVFIVGDLANVKFAATVEGIKYGIGVEGYTEHGAMTVSPAAKWAGYGFNYWTPNGASLLNVHGGPLTGAYNYPPYLLFNHVTIQTSSAFTSVETDVIHIYSSLP